MASTSVEVVGVDLLRELSRDIRRHEDGQEIGKKLRKELRGAVKPMVPAIRKNIRRMPSKRETKRRGRESLRKELARSVTLQIRTSGPKTGINIFMNPKKMPDGKKGLPGYFERIAGKQRLRHPVFGNRDQWVTQPTPPGGYFTRTTRGMEDDVQRAIRRVVNEIHLELEDG